MKFYNTAAEPHDQAGQLKQALWDISGHLHWIARKSVCVDDKQGSYHQNLKVSALQNNRQKRQHLSRVVIVEGIFAGRVGAGHRDAAETADPTNCV